MASPPTTIALSPASNAAPPGASPSFNACHHQPSTPASPIPATGARGRRRGRNPIATHSILTSSSASSSSLGGIAAIASPSCRPSPPDLRSDRSSWSPVVTVVHGFSTGIGAVSFGLTDRHPLCRGRRLPRVLPAPGHRNADDVDRGRVHCGPHSRDHRGLPSRPHSGSARFSPVAWPRSSSILIARGCRLQHLGDRRPGPDQDDDGGLELSSPWRSEATSTTLDEHARNGRLVAPERQRQHLVGIGDALEALDRDEAVDLLQLRPQPAGVVEIASRGDRRRATPRR